MIDKAVKFGKVLILVSFVIILIYLLSVSSLFTSEEPTVQNPSDQYNFTVEKYDNDDIVAITMTEGSNLSDATVEISHNPELSSNHSRQSESTEISLERVGSVATINTLSSESINEVEISKNNTSIYTRTFETNLQQSEPSVDDIKIYLIQDKNIEITESIEMNARSLIGPRYDSDTESNRYNWEMGDGTEYNSAQISHKYSRAGTYEVNLTVDTDEFSETRSFNVLVEVQDPIDEIVGPKRAEVGQEVTFNGEESTTNQAASFEWIINGQRYNETNPTVTFTERGTHQVTLTARSRSGDIQTERTTIIVFNQSVEQ